jgi:RND family efflux transporter MFP subunit
MVRQERRKTWGKLSMRARLSMAVAVLTVLSGCEQPPPPAAPGARPVRTVTVERRAEGELVSLTGQIKAQNEVSFAFRMDGRLATRLVNVGDAVVPGQAIATLDPENQQNALRSAQAALTAARAVLVQTTSAHSRQQSLIGQGYTTRAQLDQARQAMESAQAQVDSAQAQLRTAQDQLSYTRLVADAAGTVTAKGAEPGEVVRAGQAIVQVARREGRDAIFDVPAQLIRIGPRDPLIDIALTDDPRIRTTGRVREVAPQADPVTRTYQVKVGLTEPPPAMLLGATVTGSVRLAASAGVEIPASALTTSEGRPAVWVVDTARGTVAPRQVEIARYDPASVIVAQGLETGDVIVTAGVQVLHNGQKVRLLGNAP